MFNKLFSFLFLLLVSISLFYQNVYAQSEKNEIYPQVGKACPYFGLSDIQYYSVTKATLDDFRGKWLVLDFWSKTCGSCVESFPKTNAMQHKFQGKVQFMLVGIQDPEGQIELMYSAYHEKEHLMLPCDFDSLLSNEWGIYNCPHIVIVDDNGVVRGVTNTLDSADVQEFLNGGDPVLVRTYETENVALEEKKPVNFDSLFLTGKNGELGSGKLLSRSLFSKWSPIGQTQYIARQIDMHSLSSRFPRGSFHLEGLPLSYFYFYAFFGVNGWGPDDTLYGKVAQELILEIKDSSIFNSSLRGDGQNLFAYSLSLPINRGSRENMERALQEDLERTFGFKASLETRMCKCWKLVARPGADSLLKTKGGVSGNSFPVPHALIIMTNRPEKALFEFVGFFLDRTPVYDETNLTGNVDITLDYISLDDLKKSLDKYGLELIAGYTKMKAIVISDGGK